MIQGLAFSLGEGVIIALLFVAIITMVMFNRKN